MVNVPQYEMTKKRFDKIEKGPSAGVKLHNLTYNNVRVEGGSTPEGAHTVYFSSSDSNRLCGNGPFNGVSVNITVSLRIQGDDYVLEDTPVSLISPSSTSTSEGGHPMQYSGNLPTGSKINNCSSIIGTRGTYTVDVLLSVYGEPNLGYREPGATKKTRCRFTVPGDGIYTDENTKFYAAEPGWGAYVYPSYDWTTLRKIA